MSVLSVVLLVCLTLVVAGLAGFLAGNSYGKHKATAELPPILPAREPGTELDPALPRAAIVLNPSKNNAAHLESHAPVWCHKAGWAEPLILHTKIDDPGIEMTQEALAAGVDVVIAAGGDGTVRAVSEALAGTDTPMAIAPLGTGNLLARNLGIVLDRLEWAVTIALSGEARPIDAAYAQIEPDGPQQLFMVMAGLGFDAAVMADTNDELKAKVGWLAYIEAGTRKLAGSTSRVSLRLDDEEPQSVDVRSVLGGNCGKLQGGIELLPDARIDDGILNVLVISPKNIGQWLGVFASIAGKARNGLFTKSHQCRTVEIEADHPIEIELDGDSLGETTYLRMSVEKHALQVKVPTAEQARKIRLEGFLLPVR